MRRVFCLISAISLSLIFVGGMYAQDDTLINKNVTIKGRFKAGIWEAVQELSSKGIPIGFEARENLNIDTDPRIVLKSGKLEDVLDSIVKQAEFYTWEETDGVINIYPYIDRDEKIASLLDTRIGPMKVSPGDYRQTIVERVGSLFSNGERDYKIWFLSSVGKENMLGMPDKFMREINLPATDLRTVLNKLTKTQAYAPLWTVKWSQDRKDIIVGF